MGFDNIWHGVVDAVEFSLCRKDRKLIDWDKWSIAVAAEVCQWCAIAKWISVSGKHASFDYKMTHTLYPRHFFSLFLFFSWKIQMNYELFGKSQALFMDELLIWHLLLLIKRLSLALTEYSSTVARGRDLSRGNWTITMTAMAGKKKELVSRVHFLPLMEQITTT